MYWFVKLYCFLIPTIGDFWTIILIYAVLTRTHDKMKPLKWIILKMAIMDVCISQIAGWGWLPDQFYPLPVAVLHGFFSIFGSNGGLICYWATGFVFLLSATAVIEIISARLLILYQFELALWFFTSKGYPLLQLAVTAGVLVAIAAGGQLFMGNTEDLYNYAAAHNLTRLLTTVDRKNDAIIYAALDLDLPIELWIIFVLIIINSFFVMYCIAYFTHWKIFCKADSLSTEQKKLQRSLTIMLFAQTTLPIFCLFIPLLGTCALMILNPILNNHLAAIAIDWNPNEIGYLWGGAPVVLYAPLNSLLTLYIILPYRKLVGVIFKKLTGGAIAQKK